MIGRVVALGAILGGCWIAPDPPACRAPRALTELNTNGDEFGPIMTRDRLEIVYTSSVGSTFHLFHADRTDPGARFDHVEQLDTPQQNLNNLDAFSAWLSADRSSLWFVIGSGTGGGTVYRAHRDETAPGKYATASAVRVFDELVDAQNQPLLILHVTLTDDELTLVFSYQDDLYMTTRATATDPFHAPAQLLEVSTASVDDGPMISGDGQVLVFESEAEIAFYDRIVRATRSGDDFTDPTVLDVQSPFDEEDDLNAWVHPDGRTVVFVSDRPPGDATNHDLWIYCE